MFSVAQINPFRFYLNTVSCPGEALGLFLIRIGNTHAGIVVPRAFVPRAAVCRWKPWQQAVFKIFPLLRVEIWGHTHQLDQRWVFKITVLGFAFGYLTAGEGAKYGRPHHWLFSCRISLKR